LLDKTVKMSKIVNMPLQWIFEFWVYVILFLLTIFVFIAFLFIGYSLIYWIVVFPIRILYRLLFCQQGLKESIGDMREQDAIESLMHTDFRPRE